MNVTKITSSYRFKLMSRVYKKWLKKEERVLDVGCGNGIVTKLLMDQLELKITACDVKNYLIYDLPFIKIEGNRLPSSKIKYDAILLNDVLHHIPRDKQIFLLKACLKVSNKVLIFEAKPTILGKLADIILNKFHYDDLSVPLSFRSKEDWEVIFKTLSLKYKIVTLQRPFWYPFSHIAILLKKS